MVKILRENNNEIKQTPIDCIKGATLLSTEEAESLLTREERRCTYQGDPCNWWLRSPGGDQDSAASVLFNGAIFYRGNCIINAEVCIRPALIISNLQSSNLKVGDSFEFGDYTFKVISNNLALCGEIVDAYCFNESQADGNNYETSYIKDKVDRWFRDLECKECATETDDEIFCGEKGGWLGW